ncbi:sugar kinase [Lihuaxuella thermophila]|nr:sugar kinase [Lihuaxuella thermophila]
MDVVTIGETMVMFTPQTTGLLRYAKNFTLSYAGAETNVAIGLSRLGHRVGWISQVGQDELGESLISFVRGEGIDVSQVKKHPTAPTGLYIKEYLNQKEVRIYYYRHQSAASMMDRRNIDTDYISRAKFLHITGITPALSGSCREMIFEAIDAAKVHGVKVVFDPNYRAKLWDAETAKPVLLEIAARSDIILPGIDEARLLLGKSDPEEIANDLFHLGAQLVVVKLGPEGAYYQSKKEVGFVAGFPVDEVVDPVGAGDAFAAGFLSGLLEGLSLESAVQRGNAAGALVVMVRGDYEGLPQRETLMRFMKASGQDVLR